MNKRDISLPFIIISLSVVFIIVAFGVYLTKGKSRFWISKKMLIGSLLISFTSISNQSCDLIGPSCYDATEENRVIISNLNYGDSIEVDLQVDNKLTGIIYDRNSFFYSFSVNDSLNIEVFQKGEVKPKDGVFNGSTEEIFIELDTTLKSNFYVLNIYPQKQTNQTAHISFYKLIIKND